MRLFLLTLIMIIFSISIGYADGNLAEFTGYWEGTVQIMDQRLGLQVEIKEDAQEGLQGFISIPMQMMHDHPLGHLTISGTKISFSLSAGGVTANFEGWKEDEVIDGRFEQLGTYGSFQLVRAERVEEPELEVITGESEIFIETYFGNIYGSLVVPEEGDNFPVVLIIAGSGPTDRDGNNPMMGKGYIYRDLALELQERGIASLRFDKRGIGASHEAIVQEKDIRFQYYVQDVVTWIEKLKGNDKFSSITLLGHSEGSLLAILAARQKNVDGLISVAGMGRSLGSVLEEQMSNQPDPYKTEGLKIIESLRQGRLVQEVDEDLKSVFRPEIQPYLLSMMGYKPTEEIAKLNIPILILHGTTDLQIPKEDAELLHQANTKSNMVIIDGMNHVMRTSSSDLQENFHTYGTPGLPFSQGFIRNIVSYIEDL